MISVDSKDRSLALNGKRILEAGTGDVEIAFREKNKASVALPRAAVRVLVDALTLISEGHNVVVRSLDEEFSTQKSAEFLRVSRPYLIKILENGEIPFRKVGKHRRVRLVDLELYKKRIDDSRLNVLAELAVQSQELEMGY